MLPFGISRLRMIEACWFLRVGTSRQVTSPGEDHVPSLHLESYSASKSPNIREKVAWTFAPRVQLGYRPAYIELYTELRLQPAEHTGSAVSSKSLVFSHHVNFCRTLAPEPMAMKRMRAFLHDPELTGLLPSHSAVQTSKTWIVQAYECICALHFFTSNLSSCSTGTTTTTKLLFSLQRI